MTHMTWMQRMLIASGVAAGSVMGSLPAWGATSAATATTSATVTQRADITLARDSGSVSRGSASQILFDRYDDQDVTDGSGSFMYAPYRSETGGNWHVAKMFANGASMSLSADVSGTIGSDPLANRLSLFCGGFFPSSGGGAVSGTASSDWESTDSFSRTLNQSFVGTAPFNYRLDVQGVPSGAYTGTVTYTLVSN